MGRLSDLIKTETPIIEKKKTGRLSSLLGVTPSEYAPKFETTDQQASRIINQVDNNNSSSLLSNIKPKFNTLLNNSTKLAEEVRQRELNNPTTRETVDGKETITLDLAKQLESAPRQLELDRIIENKNSRRIDDQLTAEKRKSFIDDLKQPFKTPGSVRELITEPFTALPKALEFATRSKPVTSSVIESGVASGLNTIPLIGDAVVSDEENRRLIDKTPSLGTLPKSVPFIGGNDVKVGDLTNVAANLGMTAAQYGSVNKILGGLGAESKLAQFIGNSNLSKFAATEAVDLFADVVVQAPVEWYEALTNDKTLGEDVKIMLGNRGVDVLMNLAIGLPSKGGRAAVSEVYGKLRNLVKNPDAAKAVQNSLSKMDPNDAKTIVDNINTEPKGRLSKIIADSRIQEVPQPLEVNSKFIDDALVEGASTTVGLPTIAKGEPINTKSLITTELPKNPKQSVSDTVERTLQESISKMLPVEKIGGAAKIQGSNLNKTLGSIEYNVIGKQTNMLGEDIGKSVTDIFENVKEAEKADLYEYIFHKHNIDRATEGKPVFGDSVDSDMSREFVRNFEANNPNAVEIQQDITKYFRNLKNEWMVKGGLTSQETSDLLDGLYKNYVPTTRVKNLPKSLSNGNQTVAQIIKKAKGSEDKILPLDQMMIMQTDRVIKNARKNELLNTVADTFESNPQSVGRYVKEIKGGEAELLDDAFDIGKNLEVEPTQIGEDYILNFYRNGQPTEMVVNKTMYEAFKPQNTDNMVNKTASMIKKYATNPFKSLITEFNPAFSVSNVLRDIPTALAFSDNALSMVKKAPDAVKQMLTNGPQWRQFKALGGTREGLIGAGKDFKVPTIGDQSLMKKVVANANKANPFKGISAINGFTESVPRFSEYLAVLEKTGDPALAIYKSADLTTDFARHGNSTKLLDSFVPYLNPQVQGMDKFARSIVKNPLKTAVGAGAAISVPTIILDQLNKDDEDYNNLSPRERNLYFQVPYTDSNGERQFVRIPKSRELGVLFSSLLDWSARASRGQEVTGEEMYEAYTENFGIGLTPLWTPAMKALRQIKDSDSYETNYWNGLIVPESQRKYSPGQQYDLNSSGLAKAIGKQFNISPFVTDYLLKSYGGVASQFIQPIGADRKKNLLDPLTKRFMTDPVFKSDSTNKFYTELDNSRKKAQDFNRVNNLETSGPNNIVTPLEEKASQLSKIAREMSLLRKEQKELQTSRGNDDKIRELQKAINEIAEKALKGGK